MGLAGVGVAVAIGSLGYGIYAGQEAQAAQKNAIDQANQQANQARTDQQNQYNQQIAAQKAQTAANLAQEQQTASDTKAAQAAALAQEQAAIGTNSTTLQNSITNQEAAAMKQQAPNINANLQGSGLVGGGAQAQAYAQYQSGLDANAQRDIANYQVSADQNLNATNNAFTAEQVNQANQNALTNINVGQSNMATDFATQGANNQNNAAYQSYINNLQMGQAASQQQAANSYTGLAGSIGGGMMSYYGGQNGNQNNPSIMALKNAGYGSSQDLGPSWNGMQY
jgi:hypothetical protein